MGDYNCSTEYTFGVACPSWMRPFHPICDGFGQLNIKRDRREWYLLQQCNTSKAVNSVITFYVRSV